MPDKPACRQDMAGRCTAGIFAAPEKEYASFIVGLA
jgi:hypothetical protein